MGNDEAPLAMVIGIGVGFCLGILIGSYWEENLNQNEAIEAGVAGYHRTTGEFMYFSTGESDE